MAARAEVTPNRRGLRSRELVLDAAERVMAEHGFEAATVARVVEEAGIPMSSVYHYYGSKEGILLAVMERGAERFFADLPDRDGRTGGPTEHLTTVITTAARTLERHPSFLRMLIVFVLQPPAAGSGEIQTVVHRVRELALERLRYEIATAFDEDQDRARTDHLARFALATFDGAFIASRADPSYSLERLLKPLAATIVAAHYAAPRMPDAGRAVV